MIDTPVLFQQHSHVPLIVMINSTVKTISVRHAVIISERIPMNTLLLLMCWWQLHTVLEFCVVLLFLWWLVSALRECMCLILIIYTTVKRYKISLSRLAFPTVLIIYMIIALLVLGEGTKQHVYHVGNDGMQQ